MNRSPGEGDFAFLFAEGLQNPMAKLVLHGILVREFHHLASH